jgi:hypothetical protein
MGKLAVITPTFRGDAEIFADLHRSVLAFTPPDTVHHVLVPAGDRHLFARYQGPRCQIRAKSDFLPRRYLRVDRGSTYVNIRRPWPPIRGWITQQITKIAATAESDAQVVLVADSDVVLVRPVRADQFFVAGRMCLHREENAVTADMKRHVIWHQVARDLLGLPPAPPPPLPDYVAAFNVWDPQVARALQQRIAQTTGRDWVSAFTGQLHISEFILYGVFIDELLNASAPPPPMPTTICHNNWQRTPLDYPAAIAFADRLGPDAVAMMISAKSRTGIGVRRAAIQRCAEIVKSGLPR